MNFVGRDLSLDVMKGIAMIVVIIQHSSSQLVNSNWGGWIIMDVPLFFIVSGFLAYKSDMDILNMVIKKFRFIFIPFVCAIVFAMFYRGVDLVSIMSTIDKGGYWFLQALFLIFMIYAVINRSLTELKYSIPTVLMIELMLLAASKYVPDIVDNYIGVSALSRYFPCFMCGVIIRRYNISKLNLWLGCCCLFMVICPSFSVGLSGNVQFLLSVGSYSAGAILLFFFIKSITPSIPGWLRNALVLVGRYSISVYLIHFYYVYRFPEYVGGDSVLALFLVAVVAVIVALASILTSKLLTFATPLKYLLPE